MIYVTDVHEVMLQTLMEFVVTDVMKETIIHVIIVIGHAFSFQNHKK